MSEWERKMIQARYLSSPIQIGKRGYTLQELTKIGQLKTGKMLHLHFTFKFIHLADAFILSD